MFYSKRILGAALLCIGAHSSDSMYLCGNCIGEVAKLRVLLVTRREHNNSCSLVSSFFPVKEQWDDDMTNQCGVCGSTESLQYVYDLSSEGGKWRCNNCLGAGFPEGSRIVKFTDRSHPLRPAYYMAIETQEDLDLIMTVGQRAHSLGAKGIEACFYTAFKHGRPLEPNSFSLGHPDSESKLRACIDSLRMHLVTSDKLQSFTDDSHPEIIWSKSANAGTVR